MRATQHICLMGGLGTEMVWDKRRRSITLLGLPAWPQSYFKRCTFTLWYYVLGA